MYDILKGNARSYPTKRFKKCQNQNHHLSSNDSKLSFEKPKTNKVSDAAYYIRALFNPECALLKMECVALK